MKSKSGLSVTFLVFSFILSISYSCLYAQNGSLRFEHFSVEQGLSQSVITCTIQDKKGYLWFGTFDGLNRFNGYDVTIFKHNPADPSSISDNDIRCLFVDSNGNLWIGTHKGGLNKYDYKTGKFTSYKFTKNNDNCISSDRINSICQDHSGKLWIGTENGLNEIDINKNEFKKFSHDDKNEFSLIHNYIREVRVDREGTLWIATVGGLNKFDFKSRKFYQYFTDVTTIHEDKSGSLWLGTLSSGLIYFNKITNEHIYFKHNPADLNSLSDNNIRFIHEDIHGNIWIGTINGLNRLNRQTNSFKHFFFDPVNPDGLNCSELYSMCEDKEGILWFGTFGGGINKLDLRQEAFLTYKRSQEKYGSLTDNYVATFCEDMQGNLWVGTDVGGINVLNRNTNNFSHYLHNPKNKNSLVSNNLLTLFCDKSGTVWVGTFFGGLSKYNSTTNSFYNFPCDKSGSPRSTITDIVTSITEGDENIIWIGGKDGLDMLDKSKDIFTHFRHNSASKNCISDNSINCLYWDKSGVLWIGTAKGGLNSFNTKNGKFKSYQYTIASSNCISSNFITFISPDISCENILWVGTDNGLNKFDITKENFRLYSEENGLSNNSIGGILPDNQGNLWISTTNGITKFNIESEKCDTYTFKDGLQGNEFNGKASYRDKNGLMYFGGMNGFNVFHPESIEINRVKPPVVLTSFKIFNKEVKFNKPVSEIDEINLTYKDYVISFEFAALSFVRPEKNKYAYKLEGFDDNWIFTDSKRRFATYTNLLPGEYILRIKACNNDGIWNEEAKSIRIYIRPPYWQAGWFRLLALASLIAIIFFAVWYTQTRKLRKKIEKLQQRQALEKERARISKDMHDELGGSLTKILLLSRIITDERMYSKEKAEKIHRFSNEVVQKLDEIVWTVNAKNDNLKNLIAYTCEYIEEFFNATGITTRFDIPNEIPDYRLTSEQRYNIFLIIKESLNNIVKSSEASLVIFRLRSEKKGFTIEVEDNGIGFEPEKSSVCGNGLKNMKDRIESIGETIEIISHPGEGTIIKINICRIEVNLFT